MTTLLSVDRLRVDFMMRTGSWGIKREPFTAVDDVSFTVNAGEAFGLVGESGSGKSTTGRVILGLLKATSGHVTFAGKPIAYQGTGSGDIEFHRQIQAVFQDPLSSLNPRMSVGASVAEPLRWLLKMPAAEQEAEVCQLLEQVGLDPQMRHRLPQELSGGQLQRISIARAIAPRPKLIVCDEAVSALDVSTQAQVINLLQDLQQELGIAYLFIAHDLAVVRHLCQRIGVLQRGQLVEVGLAHQVHDHPQHAYTQSLLQAVPSLDPTQRRFTRR